jgi:hypothetical protein
VIVCVLCTTPTCFFAARHKGNDLTLITNAARHLDGRTSRLGERRRFDAVPTANAVGAFGPQKDRSLASSKAFAKFFRSAAPQNGIENRSRATAAGNANAVQSASLQGTLAIEFEKNVSRPKGVPVVPANVWFDPLWEPIGQGALSSPPSLQRNADAMVYISKYRRSFIEASAAFNVNPDLLAAIALAACGRINRESENHTAQIRAKANNPSLINSADMFTITQGGWRIGRMQLQISDVYAAIRKGNLTLPPLIAKRMPYPLQWFDTLTARQQYQLCAAIATDDQAAIYAAASYSRLLAVRIVRNGGDGAVLNLASDAHFDQVADAYANGLPTAPPTQYRRGSGDTGLYAKIALLSRDTAHQLLSGAEPKRFFFRGYHPTRYAPK